MPQQGRVIFIGAGPGDPDLLTIKAMKALQTADVVITDRLVSEDIITRYVSYEAQVIPAGKEGGSGFSTSQKEINEWLVAKAKEGNIVVRLKGGDVSIFSNILDELIALKTAGIPYEIIPGITALSGAAAYTGIPLTARGYSTGVRILTHYSHSIIDEQSWKEMADMKHTLVFYMSGRSLYDIVDNLLLHGADEATPLVWIEQATTPSQYVHSYTLRQLADGHQHDDFISPSLVIIGKVAHLYQDFAWLPNEGERTSYFTPLDAVTELFNEVKHGDDVRRF